MRRRFFALLLALLCLTGCQSPSATGDFPHTDDASNAYVTRNGDNYGKSGLSHSYESLCRPYSRQRLEDGLANDRPTFLFLYKDYCHSCEAAHNDLVQFFLSSLIEVDGIHFTDDNTQELLAEVKSFQADHPVIGEAIGSPVVTPSIFLIKNEEKALNLQFLDHRESLQNLYDFFKGLMNFTLVYTFHAFDAFSRFYKENDCLVYMDEGKESAPTSFYKDVYPLAKRSAKITAHIETNELAEAEKERFLQLLPSKTCEAKKGELSPIPLDSVSAYYA